MKANGLLVGVVALAILGTFVSPGHAAIDPESIVGIWLLDDGAGDVAKDASGNGNDGTLLPTDGGPQWTNESIFGGALEFSGQSVYIEFPTGENLKTPHFTIMTWFNTRKLNGYGHIFQTGKDWDDMAGYVLRVHQDGTAQAGLAFGPGNVTSFVTGPALEGDTWYHMALTYDGTTATLYLDGVSVATGAGQGEIMYDDLPVRIGVHSQDTGAAFDGFLDEVALFDAALELEDIQRMMDQGLAQIIDAPPIAIKPQPTNGQTDVPRDPLLTWTPGPFAATHNVYFGDNVDDVNNGAPGTLIADGIAQASAAPGRLAFETAYYWRVDEVNAAPDNTVFAGNIWNFTVEPLAYPIEGIIATSNGLSDAGTGPENTVNGSGLNTNGEHSIDAFDMWLATPGPDPLWIQYEFDRLYKLHEMRVWNYNVMFEPVLGFGLKDVTVEYSENGSDWTVLGEVELAKATATADYTANTTIDCQGLSARFVRLNVNSGQGPMGQFGLSEVRFMFIPVLAREPQPADGATGVSLDATLTWRAGREAAIHDVYLGNTPDALALVDSVSDNSFTPAELTFGATYSWRIDEVNEAEAVSVWASDLWSFSAIEYAVIDDMESYDDEDNTIFDTWLDGFVNGTGSTVGYFDAPFAERTIVNSGSQSMPLEYVNDTAPFYSEAEYDLGGMDLDTNGADTLRLFVAGQAPAFAETADGAIVMNAIGTDIWGTADEFRYVYKTINGDGSMVARVDSLLDSDAWAKGGVMIRETSDAGAAFAAVYLTGDNGVHYQARLTADADAVSDSSVATAEQIALREPVWVKIERTGNAFNGYYSLDGENWTPMAWNPQTIDMAATATIGLALTSHNAAVTTGAAFAGVAEEGGVSGNWQVAEIGVAQPTTGNDIEPLYVALEDTSGNVAVVTHPNPAAVAVGAWQEWLIPYSDLAGINLSRVATIYIGIGDRDNPTAGGTGTIFVDDIAYGHPASATE